MMKRMRYLAFALLMGVLLVPATMSARVETVYSPNHEIGVNFEVKGGVPVYNVSFKGQPLIQDSRLGL